MHPSTRSFLIRGISLYEEHIVGFAAEIALHYFFIVGRGEDVINKCALNMLISGWTAWKANDIHLLIGVVSHAWATSYVLVHVEIFDVVSLAIGVVIHVSIPYELSCVF